jgi:acetyl-CoA C-acetyltransferase
MEAYIIAGSRTAIGKFNGSLTPLTCVELGAAVVRDVVARAGVQPGAVNEVIIGNLIGSGLGQNPARQSSIKGGIPQEVPAFTINKACGSGVKTVVLGAQSISLGSADVVISGGMEHMTNAPYVIKTARFGQRLGNGEMFDSIITDALTDAFNNYHMGITAENIAKKYGITRQEQDEFAASSQQKAEKAVKSGRFKDEIVPVQIPQGKGEPLIFDTDEFPKFGTTVEGLAKMRPAFQKDGTVTAGNASGINDGAAAVAVVSKKMYQELKPKWAFKILGAASAGLDPAFMGLGPVPSSKKVLAQLKMDVKDLDLIEVNEAFAVQSIEVHREMGWDLAKVNVNGGAIALGHPVGCSGTRIIVTLMYEMLKRDSKLGLASLCIGGGQGISIVLERVK